MSVLNKYNQRVIAILGTITIVSLSIVIVVAAIFLIGDLFDSPGYRRPNQGLTTKKIENEGQIMRDQEISFGSPKRLDSARQIYLIPVTQVDLKTPEEVYGLPNYSSRKLNVDSDYYSHNLNNLVIYEMMTGQRTPVFKEKTSIDRYQSIEFEGNNYILITATQEDSNIDEKLDNSDLQSLFLYDVNAGVMHKYAHSQKGLSAVRQLYKISNVVAFFTKDKNRDGELNRQTEPDDLTIISLMDFSENPLVSEQMTQELQRIVD